MPNYSGKWTPSQILQARGQGLWPLNGPFFYVDDVFSTYLYEGNSSSQTITTDINASDNDALFWAKMRDAAGLSHRLADTVRGINKVLVSNTTAAEATSGDFTSASSTGITVNYNSGNINQSGNDDVLWTFRKQAGFFDVVTYTGDGTAGRTVSHNLGSKPAFIMIKVLNSGSHGFFCYHESLGATKYLTLNTTNAANTGIGGWNDTEPTSTEFTLGSWSNVNGSSFNYVAYLFAHDDQRFGEPANQSIIKCGSYTGNGTVPNATTEQAGPEIDLGWEPQWVMIKRTDSTSDWFIFDTMRGFSVDYTGQDKNYLRANSTSAETALSSSFAYLRLTSTGFKITAGSGAFFNENGGEYIYVAIRRPMKTIETNTELFKPIAVTTTTPTQTYSVGFPADLFLQGFRTLGISARTNSRITGSDPYLQTASTAAEQSGFGGEWDLQDNYTQSSGVSTTAISYFFRRAPGFMDAVGYRGDGASSQSINHNLGVAPELMIIKQRNTTRSWAVYSSATGTGKFLKLEDSAGVVTQSGIFDTAPTSSVFTVGSNTYVNASGGYYIAYLFATLAGISKVGSYTGTAASLDIDCGFTAGARFILIKRTDSTDDWYYWDSERGIVSGDDPYLLLNTTGVEQTNQNYVNPYSAGFTMTSNGFSSVNVSGGTYIFLAIA